MQINELNPAEALTRLQAGDATFIDVRDMGSYLQSHIPGAQHIGDHNISEFIESEDKTRAVIVYCYHGNSSRGGAAHLENHGFQEVYSMSGGFTAWFNGPVETGIPHEETISPASPEPPPDTHQSAAPPISRRRRLLGKLKRMILD